MTVKELIEHFDKIEDKDSQVLMCFVKSIDGAAYYADLKYVQKVTNINTNINLVYLLP